MNQSRWVVTVGRLLGIEIRVHLSLLLLIPLLLSWFSLHELLLILPVIGAAVLLHEMGHALMSRRLGVEPQFIILWPFGGLTVGASCPGDPKGDALVYAAGPAVNLVLGLMGVIAYFGLGLLPDATQMTTWCSTLILLAWMTMIVNGLLMVVNLIPAFPLDGGGILRGILWGRGASKREATILSIRIARYILIAIAIAMAFMGWLFSLLVALGLLFHGWQMEQSLQQSGMEEETGFMGYDFSQGYTSLEGRGVGTSRRAAPRLSWWERRRLEAAARRAEREAEELAEIRQRVDELLEQVTRSGLDSLSAADRNFLKSSSARFRA